MKYLWQEKLCYFPSFINVTACNLRPALFRSQMEQRRCVKQISFIYVVLPTWKLRLWVLPVWQFSIFLSLLLDFLYLSAVPSLMTYSSCEEVSELATCLNINIFRPIAFLWNPKFLDYKILINIQVISHELLE